MKSITRTEAVLAAAALIFVLVTVILSISGLRGGDIRISTTDESTRSRPQTAASGLIDINSATAAELDALPGIGETLAERIVAYRESFGPFKDVNGLLEVEGIGRGKLDAIEEFICVKKESNP